MSSVEQYHRECPKIVMIAGSVLLAASVVNSPAVIYYLLYAFSGSGPLQLVDYDSGPYGPGGVQNILLAYVIFVTLCFLLDLIVGISLFLMKTWAYKFCIMTLILTSIHGGMGLTIGRWTTDIFINSYSYSDGWDIKPIPIHWWLLGPYLVFAIPILILIILHLTRPSIINAFTQYAKN